MCVVLVVVDLNLSSQPIRRRVCARFDFLSRSHNEAIRPLPFNCVLCMSVCVNYAIACNILPCNLFSV